MVSCQVAFVLIAASSASAHGGGVIKGALDVLRAGDPVYVDATAIPTLETAEATRLRESIAAAGGEIYVAVLPADAQHELETADKVLEAIASGIGLDGAYAVAVGGQVRAMALGTERGDAAALAERARDQYAEQGLGPTLADFVNRLAADRRQASDGPPRAAIVALIGGLGLLALLATLLRARRRSSVG